MDDEIKDELEMTDDGLQPAEEGHSDYKPVNRFDAAAVHHLSGMYQNWFLDYASYTILDRAVPHMPHLFQLKMSLAFRKIESFLSKKSQRRPALRL